MNSRKKFEKTTVQDSYKWPKISKDQSGDFINFNTKESQVKCLLSPKDIKTNDVTTYEKDFIRFNIIPRSKTAPATKTEKKNEISLEKIKTTYREMHIPVMRAMRRNEFERVASFKPIENKGNNFIFEGFSEYKRSFPKKTLTIETFSEKIPPIEKIPFKGTSTMRTDYTCKKVEPYSPRPKVKSGLTPETRDFRTTYRSFYKRDVFLRNNPLFSSWRCHEYLNKTNA